MTKNRRHDIVKPSKYKTSLCSFFLTAEGCPFGDKCAFAHGETELRPEVASALDTGDCGAAAADGTTRRHGTSTPTSPDPDQLRGAGHAHKPGKASQGKRGPQTGIVLNNMARNVTAASLSGATTTTATTMAGSGAGVPQAPPLTSSSLFGSQLHPSTYAPFYAAPPGVSHVPFVALNNNQHPVNSFTNTVPSGFQGLSAPPYGMMPQMLPNNIAAPPPPPPSHKPHSAAMHRMPIVSSNVIAPAGLHRHHNGLQSIPPSGLYMPPPQPSSPQGMIMLPFASQGTSKVRTADQLGTRMPAGTDVPPFGPMSGAQRTTDTMRPANASAHSTTSTGPAVSQPPQTVSPPPHERSSAPADHGSLSFQSLMASAAPPTVVHIPLGATQLGRVTPPSGVADAVGSWPSNAAANRYYLSQEPQTGDRNVFLSSLLQQVGSGGSGAGGVLADDGSGRFGAVGGASVDMDDDVVDWSAVLESWAQKHMQEDEPAAAAVTAAATAAPVVPKATNLSSALSPNTSPSAAVPPPRTRTDAANAVSAPQTTTARPAPPVVSVNLKPITLALNKPVALTSSSAVPTSTAAPPQTASPKPPHEAPATRKGLLCSVARGAHMAGMPAVGTSTPTGDKAAVTEPDGQSVLLYNPQRNTVYYITHNTNTARAMELAGSSHTDPNAHADATGNGGTASSPRPKGTLEQAHEKGSVLNSGGSTSSSHSEHGQSPHNSVTPKTDTLPQQAFRCRPGKKKFLVLGEADSDDEADYCI